MEWIEDGLQDLRRFLIEENVQSIAIPRWGARQRPELAGRPDASESALGDLQDTEILIYEPTEKYQNVAKSTGVKAHPARAMIAELVRRYWVLGMECSLLEIQKLAWLLQRAIEQHQQEDVLKTTV
jgi:hypothetical protein